MRRTTIFILILVFFLTFFAGTTFAKHYDQDIPEIEGTYNDPGHPGIKVRVFVHKENAAKPVNSSLVCNLADPDSNATDAATGWKLPTTWTYNLNVSGVPSSVGSANLPSFAATAFSRWSSATNGLVNFVRGTDTNINRQANDGKNIVAWGRTSGSALAVTYTRYISSTGQVVDIDTIMNNKFAWSWTDQSTNLYCAASNTYDAQDILTHELGHWMGLNDHYTADFVNNTMYGYGSKGEVKKDTLTTGDIGGIQAIYY